MTIRNFKPGDEPEIIKIAQATFLASKSATI